VQIDRVSFGLLSAADLALALANDPKMPKSRKLVAVPFVGQSPIRLDATPVRTHSPPHSSTSTPIPVR
jgi:hypothetical protein